MSTGTIDIKFHFFDFLFSPFKGDEGSLNSEKILKACLQRINDETLQEKKAILINRHEGKTDADSRNMFVSSAAIKLADNKYKCQIALLRDNRMPQLVDKSNYTLRPINELGSIAETTHFYIDFSGRVPVVCCEYNYHGPRISDIEFYFRQISYDLLRISKKCEAAVHMKLPVNETLESIADVMKFDIKARPQRLNYLTQGISDPFVGNMNALAGSIKPKFLRVEAFFRERGQTSETSSSSGLKLVKRILSAIKNDNSIIDDFEDFNVTYENKNGFECVFQLLKGKHELNITCPISSPGIPKSRDLYELTKKEFDEYLQSRNN